jgi:hypothetical protein
MKFLKNSSSRAEGCSTANHLITAFSCAAVLVATIGFSTSAMAAKCNNISFRAHNTTATPMRITKVRFKDRNGANSSNWHTQAIKNYTCDSGSNCISVRPEDLEKRQNHDLHAFQFQYSYPKGNGWGSKHWSTSRKDADNERCVDGRTYPESGAFDIP